MASLTIARALFPVAVTGNGTATNLANLLTRDPKEAAYLSSTGNSGFIDLDFGANVDVDTFFAGFIASDAHLDVSSMTAPGGAGITYRGALSMGPVGSRRRHGYLKLAAPVTSRYWRFAGNGTTAIGIAAVGLSVQPAFGHEWGSGRSIEDRSNVEPLIGGGYGIDRGAIVPNWQFTCGDLTDAEVAALWELVQDVGISSPVIVCEDPTAAQPARNLGTHYGLFDRPEAYERLVPGATRWSFRVRGWI